MELECRRFKRRMLLGRHNLEQDLVREVREQAEMRPGCTCVKCISLDHLQSNSKSNRSVHYHIQSVLVEQWFDALQCHVVIPVASSVQINALLQENC